MRRGEIWWASLAKPRPVVIIPSNFFNESHLNSIVVASITSNLSLADMLRCQNFA